MKPTREYDPWDYLRGRCSGSQLDAWVDKFRAGQVADDPETMNFLEGGDRPAGRVTRRKKRGLGGAENRPC